MIKFVTENEVANNLTLANVETDQFFIDSDGCLCQKRHSESYSQIANDKGNPENIHMDDCDPNMPILKILPRVVKIEF